MQLFSGLDRHPLMQTFTARRLALGLALAALAALGGCASTPLPADGLQPVVTRTSNATEWSTPQAAADAEAAARAPRRAATASAAPTPAAPRAPAPAPSQAATVSKPAPEPEPARFAPVPPTTRTVYFDFDRFDIREDFKAVVEQHARWLAAGPQRKLRVEGHADERGGAEYNLALGQKRAQAVLTALVLLGVPEAQLEAVSFGDTRPVVRGQTEEAWAQNRRTELMER